MRIMLLTGYYEPEIAASLYLLSNMAEDLASKGCHIDVITPVPVRGIDDKTRRTYRRLKREIRCEGSLVIHRVYVPFKEPERVLLRAFRYVLVTVAVFLKALAIKTDILFVDSTPPTLGLIGIWLKRIKRVPAVYSLQDIFPDSLIYTGIITGGPLITIGRWLEKIVYANMDRIVAISQDFKRNIMKKGVPEHKIDIIYNWTDENVVVPVDRSENILLKRYNFATEAFYITYCGNIGHSQNLEILVDAAKALEYNEDMQFIIIGEGVHRQQLINYANEKGVRNVTFIPFQPYKDISHVFSLGDASLVISKHNIGHNSFPSKTWSIMSAGCPVLASFDEDSELCTLIKRANCGICVPPDDFNALRQAILELYNNREYARLLGKNGRLFVHGNLTRKAGTDNWYRIFKELTELHCKADA